MYNKVAEFIKDRIDMQPVIGLILGSGLGEISRTIENPVYINYKDIPGFIDTTVEGHLGRFVIGKCSSKYIIVMQGRFHFYEGYEMEQVVLPVRAMKRLGVETLIVTNSAGGVNPSFSPGDLMVIQDHINMTGVNPLRGRNKDDLGPRFPDMTYAYDQGLRELAFDKAEEMGIGLQQGIYAMMPGPSYETPAEIAMLRRLGADAVGMSTVPEVIAAVHAGMKVLGISCITNMAAGILDKPLSHEEVVETASKAAECITRLLLNVIQDL
ncbi:MAG: purine-nucleoside phosphorylase [Clostridiales bacterium]|nr:purine-nucleoside phosphorylase [Clostridiales bacterium]